MFKPQVKRNKSSRGKIFLVSENIKRGEVKVAFCPTKKFLQTSSLNMGVE